MSKTVVIKKVVKSCWGCPYATNSAKEWDDPFTSGPSNPRWWCTHDRGPKNIEDNNVIHKDCPFDEGV